VQTQILQHLLSGDAFFSGIGILLLAAVWRNGRWWGHPGFVTILVFVGAVLVVFSATPLPIPANLCLIFITVAWLSLTATARRRSDPRFEEPFDGPRRSPFHAVLTFLFVGSWMLAALYEAAWRHLPLQEFSTISPLIIIADSVTAGVDENEAITWPNLLARDHGLQIVDLSRMGDTLSSAIQRVQGTALPEGLVVIELGGNDVLGTTTVEEFDQQLELLLQLVTRPARDILMFELPLPPLGNRFGQIQRRLASKYHVQLIPKCVLAELLLSPETTLDSIHLTQTGHERLAQAMWKILSGKPLAARP